MSVNAFFYFMNCFILLCLEILETFKYKLGLYHNTLRHSCQPCIIVLNICNNALFSSCDLLA